jgi:hypothetical protein
MEETYGLHPIADEDGQIYLTVDYQKGGALQDSIEAWSKIYDKMRKEDFSEEEYSHWKANYPDFN